MLTGGCLCGVVRYRTDGAPFHSTICHCSLCRRASGAPFVAWFSVPRRTLEEVSGAARWFRSSAHGERGFCADCGTSLFFRSSKTPRELDITTASLDDPECLPPRDQVFTQARISWVEAASRLPAFPAART